MSLGNGTMRVEKSLITRLGLGQIKSSLLIEKKSEIEVEVEFFIYGFNFKDLSVLGLAPARSALLH